MKVSQVIAHYVALKQSMGARFHTEAVILKAFSKALAWISMENHWPKGWRVFEAPGSWLA